MDDLQQLEEKNQMIRRLIQNWDHPTLRLFVLDFGSWIDRIMEWNAYHIGMIKTIPNWNIISPTQNQKKFTLQRLDCAKYPPSVAVACATLPNSNSNNNNRCTTCIRNRLSIDGMHWCMESIAGRVLATTACLIECSLLQHHRHHHLMRECERRCNDDFMSMKPAADIIKSYNNQERGEQPQHHTII